MWQGGGDEACYEPRSVRVSSCRAKGMFVNMTKQKSGGIPLSDILHPQSKEALDRTLGRGPFLKEILLAFVPAVLLILILAIFVLVIQRFNTNPFVIIILGLCAIIVLVLPTCFYATLRLNAAVLARERKVFGQNAQIIHAPLRGPHLLRRSMVAGSVRSRLLAGLPAIAMFWPLFLIFGFLWNPETGVTGIGIFVSVILVANTIALAHLAVLRERTPALD